MSQKNLLKWRLFANKLLKLQKLNKLSTIGRWKRLIAGTMAAHHKRVQWRFIKLVKDYILINRDEIGLADIAYAPLALKN